MGLLLRAAPLVLLLLLPGALVAQAADGARRFTLAGQVLDYASGHPVAGALVTLRESGRRAIADEEGRFVFRDLREGGHTFVTGRLGYVENAEWSEVHEGDRLVVALLPRPIELEGVTALADVFRRRRLTVGFQSYAADRAQLLSSTASSTTEFLADRFQVRRVDCPGEGMCMLVRGYPRDMRVYWDGAPIPGGVSMLDHFPPGELYQVELYPALGQIHVFTHAYVDWLLRHGRPLPPLCIAC